MLNRGFVVVVGVVPPGREVHPGWGPGRGGRVRWKPAGFVEDEGLANAMVQLLRERSPGVQARTVPLRGLVAGLGGEEAERVLERLHNRTTADAARARELEREAAKRLAEGLLRRRSEVDRRSGVDRRAAAGHRIGAPDRRVNRERRSGVDRRGRASATAESPAKIHP